MLYQLPNGKVVNLDVSDILDMSDADVQFLLSINAGEYVANPFQYSSINLTEKKTVESVDEEDNVEEEEMETYYEEFFPDEFPDVLDDFDIDFDNL